MNIVILTLTYPPEPAEHIHQLAKFLTGRLHDVTVLTSLPSYPYGRIYDSHRGRLWQKETVEGIRIVRLPVLPSHTKSFVMRALFYFSNSCSLSVYLLAKKKAYDIALVYHPPLTMAIPGILLKKCIGTPFIYWIHDMWPETIEAQTGINKVTRFIGYLAGKVYHQASHIVVLSKGFKKNLMEKGISGSKISVISNWADPVYFKPLTVVDDDYKKYRLNPRDFHIVYAGNLGLMQSLDDVIRAMTYLRHLSNIKLVFMGTGVRTDELKKLSAELGLADRVIFLGRVPDDEVNKCYSLADTFIIHIKDIPLNRITIPHKIYGYMLSAKPVIAGIAGDALDEILQAGAGIACLPQNPASIAKAMEDMYHTPKDTLKLMGSSGRSFLLKERTIDVLAAKFEKIIYETAENEVREER